MTALTDAEKRAMENVVYGFLARMARGSRGVMTDFATAYYANRLADARTVAALAGIDLTLPHFAPLVDVIEQAIALPDRQDGAA